MTVLVASPQFLSPAAPLSMQDVIDNSEREEGTLKEQLAARGKSLLEALTLNATLIDQVNQQETVLTHQTEILTIMTEYINQHIEAGTIDPQLSELADKITSSNAYASAAWMSDNT